MIGKSFEKILYVVGIGVLQLLAVLGCEMNSDCPTPTKPLCCPYTIPPRCMDSLMCYYYVKDNTKKPTYYPKVSFPDYNRFTVPDYDEFTHPNFNDFTVPNIDRPTFHYNDYNDDYTSTDQSSGLSSGASIATAVVISILLTILIVCLRCVRYRARLNHFHRNCIVQRPAATNNSRTNLRNYEEPSRIVIIAVTRDEDHIRRQNRPPDGEAPFLSEEDLLQNLHNSCAQEPPPYEETTAGPDLPKYEDLVNAAMDQPPPPVPPEAHTTSRSSMNPSQITPQIQQNLPIPNVNPPPYEEAEAATNQAIEPLP